MPPCSPSSSPIPTVREFFFPILVPYIPIGPCRDLQICCEIEGKAEAEKVRRPLLETRRDGWRLRGCRVMASIGDIVAAKSRRRRRGNAICSCREEEAGTDYVAGLRGDSSAGLRGLWQTALLLGWRRRRKGGRGERLDDSKLGMRVLDIEWNESKIG